MTQTFCYIHPNRESTLRCKKCDRYICTSCAIGTPTGYMCKECINERKKIFDTALWYDYLIGFGITFILSLIASILVGILASFIGFFIFFLAAGIGSGAGVFISNITLRALNKRRSRALFYACATGVVLGAIPIAIGMFFIGNWFAAIAVIIYAVIVTPQFTHAFQGFNFNYAY